MMRIYLFLVLFYSWNCTALEFWVATNGNDSNRGSKSHPFASLERAREAIRQAKQAQIFPRNPITVWIRKGDYIRTNTLELTAADSGGSEAQIVWQAYKDEPVRLLGGRLLTGFKPVSDAETLRRLDETVRNQVLQINLKEMGIVDFGELKSRGFARGTQAAQCELFYDHKPMTLARWPNEGEFARIAGCPPSSNHTDEHGGQLGELTGGFLYSGERLTNWHDISDLWVHGYWAYDWANSYEKVIELAPERHLIKTAPPHGLYGYRKGQRFYFLNLLEELDRPGEWFLDRKGGLLYFWPPSSHDRKKKSKLARTIDGEKEIVLSLLGKPLLKLDGVTNIVFRGLTFEATRANAIEVHNGASNRVVGCLIRNIGNTGVVIEGGVGHGVLSCDVIDTGDGGVSLTGGDRQTLTPGQHFVENCHFQRQGRWSKCYVPAVALDGVGLRASHNLIHEHPHCAILFWGNDHLIEFNEIHHIALETGDVGAIYTGRDYTFRGNRIFYNFIHHTGGVGMGSMGVYMDDCVSGTEVYGNVFYQVHWAMFLGGGRDHRVENNVFVDCDPAIRADARGLESSPVWRDMVNDYMRGKLMEVPQKLYREHYPDLISLDRYYGAPGGPPIKGNDFHGIPAENNVLSHNVCSGKWLEAAWHANRAMLKVENNFTNAASSFVSPREERHRPTDFELKKDSPAWAMGFRRIPLEQIGLRDDPFRNKLNRLRPE